jgi:hypothetical protein
LGVETRAIDSGGALHMWVKRREAHRERGNSKTNTICQKERKTEEKPIWNSVDLFPRLTKTETSLYFQFFSQMLTFPEFLNYFLR